MPRTTTNSGRSHGRRWTYADYRKIPADRKRHEIIDGRHYVSPAPGPYHQKVGARLLRRLLELVEDVGIGEVFISPIDVHLAPGTVVQPDLVVLRSTSRSMIGATKINGVPELLVEILSPGNRNHDLRTKLHRYEQAGVGEYWIVDPAERRVLQFCLQDDGYRPAVVCTKRIALRTFRGVAIDLAKIW